MTQDEPAFGRAQANYHFSVGVLLAACPRIC